MAVQTTLSGPTQGAGPNDTRVNEQPSRLRAIALLPPDNSAMARSSAGPTVIGTAPSSDFAHRVFVGNRIQFNKIYHAPTTTDAGNKTTGG